MESGSVAVVVSAAISVAVFCLCFFCLRETYFLWTLIIPCVMGLAWLCGKFEMKIISLLGVISLESYLANVYLGDILNHMPWRFGNLDLSYGHYLEYACVLVFGLLLAVLSHRLNKKILSK